VPLERTLRIYFLQAWFNLSDPAVEEALYDSVTMRAFAGVDLGQEAAPDETTVCKFRHLLKRHKLGKQLLETVNRHLKSQGIKITNGTIVDATIISDRVRPRTATGSATLRCIRPPKASNGISE
jgi:transposase, IS5 family